MSKKGNPRAEYAMRLASALSEREGAPIVARADQAFGTRYRRIPTGILELDLRIGGGLPWGKFVSFYGPYSGSKTTSALIAVGTAQKHCRWCFRRIIDDDCACPPRGACRACLQPAGKCRCRAEPLTVTARTESFVTLWHDAENSWENDWAVRCGVDPERVIVMRSQDSEQGIDLGKELLAGDQVDILVVDSLAALVPAEVTDASVGDAKVAANARLVGRALAGWSAALARLGLRQARYPVVLCINQVRNKVGVFYGSPEVRPGGIAQDHYDSITVRFRRADLVRDKGNADGAAVAQVTAFEVKKNKTFPPGAKGQFVVGLSGPAAGKVDDVRAVFEEAKRLGLLADAGAQFALVPQLSGLPSGLAWPSQKECLLELRRNLRLYDELRLRVVAEVCGLPVHAPDAGLPATQEPEVVGPAAQEALAAVAAAPRSTSKRKPKAKVRRAKPAATPKATPKATKARLRAKPKAAPATPDAQVPAPEDPDGGS